MCSFVADARIAFPLCHRQRFETRRDVMHARLKPMGHRFSCRVKSCWSIMIGLTMRTGCHRRSASIAPREANHARNTRLASKQGRAYTPAKSSAR
jgi:hypothetical protein